MKITLLFIAYSHCWHIHVIHIHYWWTETETDRQTDRQIDREKQRERDRERQREGAREGAREMFLVHFSHALFFMMFLMFLIHLAFPFIVEAFELINGTHTELDEFEESYTKRRDVKSKVEGTQFLNSLTIFGFAIGMIELYILLHLVAKITQKLQWHTVICGN